MNSWIKEEPIVIAAEQVLAHVNITKVVATST